MNNQFIKPREWSLIFKPKTTGQKIGNFFQDSARFVISSILISLTLIAIVLIMAWKFANGAFGVQGISYITVFQLAFMQLGSLVGVVIGVYTHQLWNKNNNLATSSSKEAGSVYALLFGIILLLIYFPTTHVYNQFANNHINTLFAQEQGVYYIYGACLTVLFAPLKQYWLSIIYSANKNTNNKIAFYIFEFLYYGFALGWASLLGLTSELKYIGFSIGLSVNALLMIIALIIYLSSTKHYEFNKVLFIKTQFKAIIKATWNYSLISVLTSILKMFVLISLFYIINEKVVGSTPLYLQASRIIWYQTMMFVQMLVLGLSDYLIYLLQKQKITHQKQHSVPMFITMVLFAAIGTILLGVIFGFSIPWLSRSYTYNQDLIINVEANNPPSYLYVPFRKKLIENPENVRKIIEGFSQTADGKILFTEAIQLKLLGKLNNDQPLNPELLTMWKQQGFDTTLNTMINQIAVDKLNNDQTIIDQITHQVQIEFIKKMMKTNTLDKNIIQAIGNNQFLDVVHQFIKQISDTKQTELQQLIYSYQIDILHQITKTESLTPTIIQKVLNNEFNVIVNEIVAKKVASLSVNQPSASETQIKLGVQKAILQGLYKDEFTPELLASFDDALNNYVNKWANNNLQTLVKAEIVKTILKQENLNYVFNDLVDQILNQKIDGLNLDDSTIRQEALWEIQTQMIMQLTHQKQLNIDTITEIKNNHFNEVLQQVLINGVQSSDFLKYQIANQVQIELLKQILKTQDLNSAILNSFQINGFNLTLNQLINQQATNIANTKGIPVEQAILAVKKQILVGLYKDLYSDALLNDFDLAINQIVYKLVGNQIALPVNLNRALLIAQTKLLLQLNPNLVSNNFDQFLNQTITQQVHNNPKVFDKVIQGIQTRIIEQLPLTSHELTQGMAAINEHKFNAFMNETVIGRVLMQKAIDQRLTDTMNALKSNNETVSLNETKKLIDPLWIKTDDYFIQKINQYNPVTKIFKHLDENEVSEEFFRNNSYLHLFILCFGYPMGLILIRYSELIRSKSSLPFLSIAVQILVIGIVVWFGIEYQTTDMYKGMYAWSLPLSIIGTIIFFASVSILLFRYNRYMRHIYKII
ncbi:hypothetical protein OF377_00445 [Ureaplasma sp. ES3154-GEN]|uniref:hypothetical protein n=1 Tax=Ureaplasma sp. ES3154-GEN TaxID=2984844 RepID=UPI0021E7907D|nr:hypothetical protein [Ureaplasma sp. ES3154-GEN]MCV3743356.1 hypothetical protein [Ureaplasma sp. ES3154-GEN]